MYAMNKQASSDFWDQTKICSLWLFDRQTVERLLNDRQLKIVKWVSPATWFTISI